MYYKAKDKSLICSSQFYQVEHVQKRDFAILLGNDYGPYSHALKTLEWKPLSDWRHDLCLRFAKKSLKHEKYSNWFCTNDAESITHSETPLLKPVEALKS